ncbi:MAG: translation initiation factor IF-3, partial [Bacteroidales bacterium]|nr:translation initiation factor IF-3 [Bacteroidales bacterium]
MREHRNFQKKEQPHKINKEITSLVVRVITENGESKIVSLKEALEIANQLDLDLVEISPQTNPPVCKVIDYQKFLYNLKKKQKDIKAKTAKVTIKEIRLGPNTDDHDFNFKVKHAIGFLEEGNKVKVDVFFKGRSIM